MASRKPRRRRLYLCLSFLLYVIISVMLFTFIAALGDAQVDESRERKRQPIKRRNTFEELGVFPPSGGDLEKDLMSDLSTNLTSDLANMTLTGGHYRPRGVDPKHRIAVIVPYRDRETNLRRFLRHIHPFLQRQEIEYSIYVIEMEPEGLFRKTVLMNAGFLEVTKRENVSCIVFHDVDMVPVNINNLYYCDDTVRHLAVAITQFRYQKPYDWYIGGVLVFPARHFISVNGYSNLYIGWGGEDDDMYYRLEARHIPITEPTPDIGRYESWPHTRQDLLLNMKDYKNSAVKRMRDDGLSNVKYKLIYIQERTEYTLIRIQTDPDDIFNEKYFELQPIFLKWN